MDKNIIFKNQKEFLESNKKYNVFPQTDRWLEEISKTFYDGMNKNEHKHPEYLLFKQYFEDIYGDEDDDECSYIMLNRNNYSISKSKRDLFYILYGTKKDANFNELVNICVSKKELPNLINGIYDLTNINTNLFVSIGHFKGWKEEKNLSSVNIVYVDIDNIDESIANGDEETIKNYVKTLCPNDYLPNYITASGHGLHLIWLIDKYSVLTDGKQDINKLKYFKDFTKQIICYFNSDANCSDLGRYLRVATSNNIKPLMKPVKSRLFTLTDRTKKYNLEDLNKAFHLDGITIYDYHKRQMERITLKRKETLEYNKLIDKTEYNPIEFNIFVNELDLKKVSFRKLIDKKVFLSKLHSEMTLSQAKVTLNRDILGLIYKKMNTYGQKPTEKEFCEINEIVDYIENVKDFCKGSSKDKKTKVYKKLNEINEYRTDKEITNHKFKKLKEKLRSEGLGILIPQHYTTNEVVPRDPKLKETSILKRQYNDFFTYAKLNVYVPEGNRNNFAVHLCYLMKKMNKFRSVIQVFNEISCCFAPDFWDSLYDIVDNIYNKKKQAKFFTNETLVTLFDINNYNQKFYFTVGSEEERKKRNNEAVKRYRVNKRHKDILIVSKIVKDIRNGLLDRNLEKNTEYTKKLIEKAKEIVKKQNEYLFNKERIKDFRKRMNFIYGKKRIKFNRKMHYYSHVERLERFFAMQNEGFTKEEIMKELNIKKSTYYNYFKVYYRGNQLNVTPFFMFYLPDMLEILFSTKRSTSSQSKKQRKRQRFDLTNERKFGKLNSFDVINKLAFVDIAMDVLKIPEILRNKYKNIFKGFNVYLNIYEGYDEGRSYQVRMKNNDIKIDLNINYLNAYALHHNTVNKKYEFKTKGDEIQYISKFYGKRLKNLFLTTDDYEDYLHDLEYGDYLIYRENKKRIEKTNFLKRQENEMKKGA